MRGVETIDNMYSYIYNCYSLTNCFCRNSNISYCEIYEINETVQPQTISILIQVKVI